MQRNKNIEAMRGIAMIMMLFYHYTKIIEGIMVTNFANIVDEVICQTALITFFVISGFGTFLALEKKCEKGENITLFGFFKNRIKKIMPHYYFCIGVILITTGTGYFAWANLKAILAYVLCVQNIFPSVSGAINGATWTIAVMVQFYLIAVPMYKLVKRFGIKYYIGTLVFSQICKKVLCGIVAANGYPEVYYVIACMRQLFTTIDLFVAGMCAAMIYNKLKNRAEEISAIKYGTICTGIFILLEVGFVACIYIVGGMYGNGFKYYIWAPTTGILISTIAVFFAQMPFTYESWLGRVIQFVAHNEYGTYLWHMVIILNFASQSSIYHHLQTKAPVLLLILMMILACLIGFISTVLTDSPSYRAIFSCFKKKKDNDSEVVVD